MAASKSLPSGGIELRSSAGAAAMPSQVRRFWLGAASIGFSLATTALLLKPARPTDGSTPFGDFRGFFAFDQLSYAAIASTAASGHLARVEPFTQTGTSYYPSLWYQILGIYARTLDVGIPAAWTILGSLVLGIVIVTLGLCAISISGRTWTAALVGPALWIGPLASALIDTWYLPLNSHARLWGPYGLLYPLNAEAVGVSVAAAVISITILGSTKRLRSTQALLVYGSTSFVIGIVANIHTYAFLIATTFALGWLSALGLLGLRGPRRHIATAFSVGTIVVLVLITTTLVDTDGDLLFFGFVVLVALPGILPILKRNIRLSVVTGLLFVVGALPQLLHTLDGLMGGDEFLTYRQVQSELLGVSLIAFVVATAPLAASVVLLLALSRRIHPPATLVAVIWSSIATIVLLTFNNLWGFGQEPYRMWIGSVALSAMVLVLPAAYLASRVSLAQVLQAPTATIIAIALMLSSVSFWNLGGFRQDVNNAGSISFGSARLNSIKQATQDLDGLLVADPCIDLQLLKIASGASVAFYNPGLAWPSQKQAIDLVLVERENDEVNPVALRGAGVQYVIADTQCATAYRPTEGFDFQLREVVPYEGGAIEVWRVL